MKETYRENERELGNYYFSESRHALFLAQSGDHNPIHADEQYSATVMTGKMIVHGMHMVLAAADIWAKHHHDDKLDSINCRFITPVSIGDSIILTEEKTDNPIWKLRAWLNGTVCATLTITTDNNENSPAPPIRLPGSVFTVNPSGTPMNLPPGDFINHDVVVPVRPTIKEALFPNLANCLESHVIQSIATCSYFVGMICPGLYSLCTTLDIRIRNIPPANTDMTFHVESYDTRFHIYRILIDGAIYGTLTAYRRSE